MILGLTAIAERLPTVTVGGFVIRPGTLVAAASVLLAVTVIGGLFFRVFRSAFRRRHRKLFAFRKRVMLVTVPKETAEKGESGMQEKTLQEIQEDIGVMEGIFSAIGGLKAQRGWRAWLLGRGDEISFEMVAKDGMVSFYVVAPPDLKDFVEHQIQSQYPHAQVEDIPDYNIFSPDGEIVGTEMGFSREVFFPIRSFRKLEHDPLNALTNALSKVDRTDGAAVQVIVRSARKEWRKPAVRIASLMQQGKSLKEAKGEMSSWKLMRQVLGMAGEKPKDGQPERDRRLSPMEEEVVKSLEEKAAKLGLAVNIRLVASSRTKVRAEAYLTNLVGAFSQYNLPEYGNQFVGRGRKNRDLLKDFIFRNFNDTNRIVLNGEEAAGIFHLPLPSTETPNIRWLTARKAPPPAGLPKEGLYLGDINYRGVKTPVHIKKGDRMRHLYVIGKSGAGKSEFIANLAAQDIRNGDGICIIDPHGDLVETVLGVVPKERAEDVVIFDPSDTERPIGLNMLESPNEEMKDFMVGEMIAIFYKLFPPEMIGPMFEHNMRNFMLTLMSDRDNPGTIAEVPRLIVDPEYQKRWVAKVKDPVVLNFWQKEIAKTSDFHKSEMFGYLISKVGRFVENAMMRNIIGQQKSAFDFRQIMDGGKIFLVNLSKGKIGDINANLLGLIIVTKLQMAAFGRAGMPKEERRDFYLYIDEFQNFVTPSIATILSEARKYGLSLTIAHQYLGQLSPKGDTEIRDAVMGNVGTMMVGRIGIDDAQVLEKEFSPVFTAFDLVNVEKFTYNAKTLVDNQSTRPFNFSPPPPLQPNRRLAEAIKTLARLKYGRDRWLVEQEILERTQMGKESPAPSPEKAAS
ncbi:DUF87 domain-containing protein [Candidatus Uhrbacteria bacterium]|nr:DUF87 domain-containing protein [Candidatus Uhrbacteria bacterium]